MIDLRLYRIAFVPAIGALVVLLFSLQSQPGPLHPLVGPSGFEQATAARFARQLVARTPNRAPGSSGDQRSAAIVERTFRHVSGGRVAIQHFGAGGRLENVILKLPAQSKRQVVLIAPRDTDAPPGAASSAAATGALEALASNIGTSQHTKTLILISTDGSSQGAAGAKALADDYLDPSMVDAVIALEQPGSASLRQPYVLTSSTGANSTSFQLAKTAEATLAQQANLHAAEPGPFGQLAELALPGGLGEQAVMIGRGFNAVGLSSAGERPLRPAEDRLDDFSPQTLGRFGLTAYALVLAVDSVPGAPVHGPDAYLEVAGNLVPGWALALMALALMVPAAVGAVDALARAGRRRVAGVALAWAAPRSVPFLAALAFLYLLALAGVVPRPAFPFDPGAYGIGPSEALASLAVAIVAGAVWWSLGRNRLPVRLLPEAGAAALGFLTVAALLVIWVVNPYLALILVPLAHPWVLQARVSRRPSRALCAGTIALALVPLVLGTASVAGRLALGGAFPWHVALAIGDWGVTVPTAIAGCVLAGSLAALVALAGAGREAGPPTPARPTLRRPERVPEPLGEGASEWTNSRSSERSPEPIYEAPRRIGARRHGGAPSGVGHETRTTEEPDQYWSLPGGLGRGGAGDAVEGELDQIRADRPRGPRR